MRRICIGGFAAAMLLTVGPASTASAAPVVTQTSGPDVAAITPTVNQFGTDLGTLNGTGPPAPSGRRQIVWDGVPAERQSPAFMPENQFRNVGALFSTPGLGFQVSGDDDADGVPPAPDADPDQVEYTNLNANYATAFAPFSPERLFAPIGSNVTETRFVVPGTNTPAETNGLGVVFNDVDQQGPTKIEYLEADGDSLGTFTVPATAGDETFSFLGVRYDAGERVALARITTGGAPLAGPAPTGNDVTQGGPADIVVMDNFIYGEPQAIPPEEPVVEQPDTQAPTIDLKDVPKSIDAKSLGKGLKVSVTTNEEANVQASLLAKAGKVELRAKPQVILDVESLGLGTGERTLTLKPAKKLLRKADGFKAEIEITATDRSGNTSTVERTLKVKKDKDK